jgi:hypothetical protein
VRKEAAPINASARVDTVSAFIADRIAVGLAGF